VAFFVIGRGTDVEDDHVITGNDFVDEFLLVDLVDVFGHLAEIRVGGVKDGVIGYGRVAFVGPALGMVGCHAHAAVEGDGVVAEEAQGGDGFTRSLAGVAVDMDLLVLGQGRQIVEGCFAEGDIDRAGDVALGIVFGLADGEDEGVLAFVDQGLEGVFIDLVVFVGFVGDRSQAGIVGADSFLDGWIDRALGIDQLVGGGFRDGVNAFDLGNAKVPAEVDAAGLDSGKVHRDDGLAGGLAGVAVDENVLVLG